LIDPHDDESDEEELTDADILVTLRAALDEMTTGQTLRGCKRIRFLIDALGRIELGGMRIMRQGCRADPAWLRGAFPAPFCRTPMK
jgi:hypothetical protein